MYLSLYMSISIYIPLSRTLPIFLSPEVEEAQRLVEGYREQLQLPQLKLTTTAGRGYHLSLPDAALLDAAPSAAFFVQVVLTHSFAHSLNQSLSVSL